MGDFTDWMRSKLADLDDRITGGDSRVPQHLVPTENRDVYQDTRTPAQPSPGASVQYASGAGKESSSDTPTVEVTDEPETMSGDRAINRPTKVMHAGGSQPVYRAQRPEERHTPYGYGEQVPGAVLEASPGGSTGAAEWRPQPVTGLPKPSVDALDFSSRLHRNEAAGTPEDPIELDPPDYDPAERGLEHLAKLAQSARKYVDPDVMYRMHQAKYQWDKAAQDTDRALYERAPQRIEASEGAYGGATEALTPYVDRVAEALKRFRR